MEALWPAPIATDLYECCSKHWWSQQHVDHDDGHHDRLEGGTPVSERSASYARKTHGNTSLQARTDMDSTAVSVVVGVYSALLIISVQAAQYRLCSQGCCRCLDMQGRNALPKPPPSWCHTPLTVLLHCLPE